MVQANELRLGNYISLNGKKVIVKDMPYLIDDNKEGYLINEVWANEYEPIPLTTEILQTCFNASTNGIELAYNVWLVIHIEREEANIYDIYKNETLQLRIQCKYLHQLQNLYFALTGEELTVNLSTP